MTTARRILDAVTLRRILAVLLVGGFAKEIFASISWLTATGWGLAGVASVRACLMAALALALNAALIYVTLRGLGSVLGRRRGKRETPAAQEAADEAHYPTDVFGQFEATETEPTGRPREGGGNGRGPDRF